MFGAIVVALAGLRHAERLEIGVRHAQTFANTVHATLVCATLGHAPLSAGFANVALFAHTCAIQTTAVAVAVIRACLLFAEITREPLVAYAHTLGSLTMLANRLFAVCTCPFLRAHTSTLDTRAMLGAILRPASRL